MGEVYEGERVRREWGLSRSSGVWGKEVVEAVGLCLFCVGSGLGSVGGIFNFVRYVDIGELICVGDEEVD